MLKSKHRGYFEGRNLSRSVRDHRNDNADSYCGFFCDILNTAIEDCPMIMLSKDHLCSVVSGESCDVLAHRLCISLFQGKLHIIPACFVYMNHGSHAMLVKNRILLQSLSYIGSPTSADEIPLPRYKSEEQLPDINKK